MIQPQVRLLSLLNKIMVEIKLYNNGKIETISFDEKDDYYGFSKLEAVVTSKFAKEFIEV